MEIAHHNSAVEHHWTEESYICEIILNHIEFIGDDCSGEIVHPYPDIFWLYIFFVIDRPWLTETLLITSYIFIPWV